MFRFMSIATVLVCTIGVKGGIGSSLASSSGTIWVATSKSNGLRGGFQKQRTYYTGIRRSWQKLIATGVPRAPLVQLFARLGNVNESETQEYYELGKFTMNGQNQRKLEITSETTDNATEKLILDKSSYARTEIYDFGLNTKTPPELVIRIVFDSPINGSTLQVIIASNIPTAMGQLDNLRTEVGTQFELLIEDNEYNKLREKLDTKTENAPSKVG